MSKLTRLILAMLIGVVPVAYGQTPSPPDTLSDPSVASSPHQRDATGQSTSEVPANASPEASAASSPHQQETLGKPSDGKMEMATDGADTGTFVKKATLGGMTEVELSKVASGKTQDAKVRAFADRMVKDHGAANRELASLARSKGWDAPSALDAEHKGLVQKLSAKSGADFDAAYSKQMMGDHEKTVALFEEATNSADADLAAFAKKTLPTLKEHEHMADGLPGAFHSAAANSSMPKHE